MSYKTLLSPTALSDKLTLRNRVVMAPMTTWAANDDGTISKEEVAYYRARSRDVGMVLTGCTHVLPNGIGFTDEFAASDDSFTPSLRRLAEAAKSGGAPAVLQIFHAGNKALPQLTPGGDVVAPSPVATRATIFAPAQTPRELTEPEIYEIISAFGETTRRAIEAGFDGVELHGAHGFLIQNFFSPATNRRTDLWGGSLANRLRFARAVIAEVRQVAAVHAVRPFILGFRVSPEEPEGYNVEDCLAMIDALIAAEIDYVHVSLGNALNDRPQAGPDGKTLIELIVDHVDGRIPVIAAGGLRTPAQAAQALALGLSCVAIGQGLVMNPNWVALTAADRAAEISTELDPAQINDLAIPRKLWAVIEAMTGWFAVKQPA